MLALVLAVQLSTADEAPLPPPPPPPEVEADEPDESRGPVRRKPIPPYRRPGWTEKQPALGPEPAKGLGQRIGGFILLGAGAANLAGVLVCKSDLIRANDRDVCFIESIVVGGTAVLIGIPLIIAGFHYRSEHHEWEIRRIERKTGPSVTVFPLGDGLALGVRGAL